jgi:uncharacterized membrane protein
MTVHHARDAAYDVVLIAHVFSALAGFGVVAVAGAYALALRRPGPPTEVVRRYYRPGVNWAGRILFAVPVLGAALVAMSGGDWSYSEGWVLGGILLWAAAAAVAELLLWPGERALQAAVAATPGGTPDLGRRCLLMAANAGLVAVLLVVATVAMMAKP